MMLTRTRVFFQLGSRELFDAVRQFDLQAGFVWGSHSLKPEPLARAALAIRFSRVLHPC